MGRVTINFQGVNLTVVDGFVAPFLWECRIIDECNISFAKLHSPCTVVGVVVVVRDGGVACTKKSVLSPKA